jgi:predicted amidophosphoribosyltransferase
MKCSNCGYDSPPDKKFCKQCGKPMTIDQPAIAPRTAPPDVSRQSADVSRRGSVKALMQLSQFKPGRRRLANIGAATFSGLVISLGIPYVWPQTSSDIWGIGMVTATFSFIVAFGITYRRSRVVPVRGVAISRPERASAQQAGQVPEDEFCSECGSQLSPGKKFCTKCGSPVGKTPRIRPVASSVTRCPNPQCGHPVSVGKKFCTVCGTRVQTILSEPASCSRCGQRVEVGKKFCKNCGSRLAV